MSCERHRPALIDAALGIAETPELARHLAECGRCSAQLERQRGLLSRIDGEIQGGMDVTASAAFVARVRQRAAQRKSEPWRVTAWLLPFAAAVAVLALGGLVLGRRAAAPPAAARPTVVEQRRPLPQPSTEPDVPPQPAAPAAPERAEPATARAPAPVRRAEPEVFLRPGEAALVRRFAETIRHQPVRAAVLLQAGFDPGGAQEVPETPIVIRPLSMERGVIGPLPVVREEIKPLTDARPAESDDVKPPASETQKRSES